MWIGLGVLTIAVLIALGLVAPEITAFIRYMSAATARWFV